MISNKKLTLLKLIVALIFSALSTLVTVLYLLPSVSPVIGTVFLAFTALCAITTDGYAQLQ